MSTKHFRCALAALPVLVAFLGCESAPSSYEGPGIGHVESAVFTNGGFETGTAGQPPPAPWAVQTFLGNNPTGVNVPTVTRSDLNLQTGGTALTTILRAPGGPLTQTDPGLGAGASLRWPRYGNNCAVVNGQGTGNNHNVNSLTQTMTVGAGDVDPTDGKVHVRFVVAPVLQNPAHPANQQPWYFVQLTNVTRGNAILYKDFNLSAQAGVPWKTVNGGTANEIDYTDWQLVDISPAAAQLAQGDQVMLEVIAAGCSLNAHYGQIYVDGLGQAIPGLYISGTGPAQANAGSNITYALRYRNGAAAAETGVVIDLTTPPGTTFQSIVPPAGATCVTPAVGAAGTIVCTFSGPVPAGATGTLGITLAINPAATGAIVEGNYDIHSIQEPPLLGNHIVTVIGCATDTDCAAGNWCHESAPNQCLPTLPNGTAIPTDPPHTGPVLNGTCTPAAGALVCTSGICDTADNRCGLLNGDGPCTAVSGGVVCRSGVCDPDLKCGYAVGDGPCTAANQGVVCRSGACSVNGLCEPAGGCNVDADCSGGNWCLESTHVCTPKLPNGAGIPTDPPHVAPTLNGTCTAAAANLVCVSAVCDTNDNKCGLLNSDGPCTVANGGVVCRSGVCDPDLKCGYANGDGPCTAGNGGVVCRSGTCSKNGLCEPAGGCNVDADCTGGNWCLETTHVCTPKLPNGSGIPTDGPHTSPTLNGTCTAAAAALVCVSGVCDVKDNKCGFLNSDGPCTVANGGVVCRSGVCDPDLKCGYADGDGPCTAGNQGTVCRSGSCSSNGLCQPANGCNVDADCSGGKWCNESAHACTDKLPNGTGIPTDGPHTSPTLNGTCTAAAGALVCVSGVCDTKDNKCGYANGDGPCSGASGGTVCRSKICATSGTNANVCVACVDDSACASPTPACDAKNTCVQCSPGGNKSACVNPKPICDPTSESCAPCDGDHGEPSKDPCGEGAPTCELTGTGKGSCGKCTTNADCNGHPLGTVCDTGTGACTTGCRKDSDCDTTRQWCNAPVGGASGGTCVNKIPNGEPLPSTPPEVATCTDAVGVRVCVSAKCDPKDNHCGLANGTGPCTSPTTCRSAICDPDGKCGKVDGETCTAAADCRSGACTGGVCGGSAAGAPDGGAGAGGGGGNSATDNGKLEGGGLSCSAAPGASGSGGAALFGLGLVALGRTWRRRRRG